MNGGSLGLRTGSYGSLGGGNGSPFPPSPGGGAGGGAALPIQAVAAVFGSGGRKGSKLSLAGSKERRLSWICKVASRRKVGMLLLFVASAAVLLSFVPAFTKGPPPLPTFLLTLQFR
ncbi:hypothetical protein M6B38_198880 [Iris pallida]|uniref:Uncharacterized protein n=1 Tax=Iris pallida TaxID=29817 RepID=A0AAX6EBC0_IRIPA|nr:hypothetical protein M6B38_198880 [Iris pallida]